MQQSTKEKTAQLVQELQHLFGERLVSACVYGSAVFQEELPDMKAKYKDINVLVILESLDLSDLEKASSVGKWWERVGHSLPLFLSEAEWEQSKDVFALEYADIQDNHYVAYGKDVFSAVEVVPDALRLVCELELHRKLIFLRQRLLLYRDKPDALLDLLQSSVNSFSALFRGVLRLQPGTQAVPQKSYEVFEALRPLIQAYDPTPFLRVLESKESGKKIRHTDVFSIYTQFIQQLSLVVAYVDSCFGFVVRQTEGVRS